MTRKIATQNIYAARGVLAYVPGDVVPASAIETLGCADKVAGETSKAAAAAKAVTPTPDKTQ